MYRSFFCIISTALGFIFFLFEDQVYTFQRFEETVFEEITSALMGESGSAVLHASGGGGRVSIYEKATLPPISVFSVTPEAKTVFENLPLTASDWSVAINNLRKRAVKRLYIQNDLSWEGGNELELSALLHELDALERVAIGINYRLVPLHRPLPDYLKRLTLTKKQIRGNLREIPEVNQTIFPPSTDGAQKTSYGFLDDGTETNLWTEGSSTVKVPMLVRWGEHLLPSWALSVIVSELGIEMSDVRINLGAKLILGASGQAIKIDSFGYAELPLEEITQRADAKPIPLAQVLDKERDFRLADRGAALIIDQSKNAPQNLALVRGLQGLISKLVHQILNYPRIPNWLMILLLANLSLLGTYVMWRRKQWIVRVLWLIGATVLIPILVLGMLGYWCPLLPLWLSLIVVILFCLLNKKGGIEEAVESFLFISKGFSVYEDGKPDHGSHNKIRHPH